MASQQGSFTDAVDACDKLVAFLQSSGWTLNQTETFSGPGDSGKAHCVETVDGNHFVLRSVQGGNSLAAFNNGGYSGQSISGIGLFGLTGFTAATTWFSQPGLTHSWDGTDEAGTSRPYGVSAQVDRPGSYDFFVFDEVCYAFFIFSPDHITYMHFGGLTPNGTGSAATVPFLTASGSTATPLTQLNQYNALPGPFSVGGGGSELNGIVWHPVADRWCSSGGDLTGDWEWGWMGGWCAASPNIGLEKGAGGGGLTPWQESNGKPQMTPFYVMCTRDKDVYGETAMSIVGSMPHAYFLGMMELTDGGTYTYPVSGGTTYRAHRLGIRQVDSKVMGISLGWWVGLAVEV